MLRYRFIATRTNTTIIITITRTVIKTTSTTIIINTITSLTILLLIILSDNFPLSPYFPLVAILIS